METAAVLHAHVQTLAAAIGERNVWRPAALERAADYIKATLKDWGYDVNAQNFRAYGEDVRNLDSELRGRTTPGEIVVVGAHYDSVRGCPGANDNASGVAAMLELARRFQGRRLVRTLRFVAFVNEEPPFFMSEGMGSVLYAKAARARGDEIVGMMSLETIGYYSDEKGSQQYPGGLDAGYPDRGNFIGFVANEASAHLLDRARDAFQTHSPFPIQAAAAPADLPGVGWSDHWGFWQAGYRAFMVTDTAPFRYPWYHTPGDTPDKLDYQRFGQVVDGLEHVVAALAD
jgi:Zn-dependent M28 family amino/carboxypeptidase